MSETSNLATAVTAVMREIGTVEKSGTNKFHGYKYASEFDLLRAVQPAMAANGLMMVPVRSEMSRVDGPSTGRGKAQWITHGAMTYELRHISGDSIQIQVPAAGIDGEDKGAYKAATGALKYALRQAFLIPTGDDPDQDEKHQPDDSKAFDEGAKSGRTWAIKQILAKARDGYHGAGAAKALKDAGIDHSLEHVKLWCLWLGRDKPSRMKPAQLDGAIKFLASPEGAESWETFAKECGPIPKPKKRVPKWFREALEALEWKVDDVRAWCESEGWGDPVAWKKEKQEGLVEALKGGEKAQQLLAWLEAR